jgi:hypothetical protein
MKKYILIIGSIILLAFGAYFFLKPKKNRVDTVYVSGPDDPIFQDSTHVMIWDKNGKVINPERIKKLLGNDSLPDVKIK